MRHLVHGLVWEFGWAIRSQITFLITKGSTAKGAPIFLTVRQYKSAAIKFNPTVKVQ